MATVRELQAEFRARASGFHQTINGIKDDLKDLGKKAKTNADEMSKQFNKASKKMKNTGKNMSLYITAPLAGIGIASAKTSMEFEKQMSRVGAIAQATSDELKMLTDSALDLGASTSKSASEVAKGQEELAAMGFTVQEILGAMPGVISASEASGADMAQTAQVMASALNIFGLEAEEATRVADILAQTANVSAADITDMQYALKYAGPPAAALGISLEELSASIGIMTDAGMAGEQAGTTLRAALLRLIDPPAGAATALEELGVSIENSDGSAKSLTEIVGDLSKATEGMSDVQKTAALSTIFGTEAVSGMLSLINAGPDEMDKFTKSLENSSGASEEAATKMMDNLAGSVEEMGGALETAGIKIGEIMTPAIRTLAGWVQNAVQAFIDAPKWVQNLVVILGVLASVIGPLLVAGGVFLGILGNIAANLPAILGVFSKLLPILKAVRTAFAVMSGPIGWIITAVGILAVVVYKNWDSIWKWTKIIFGKVVDFLNNAWDSSTKFIRDSAQKIWQYIKDAWDKSYNWTANLLSKIGNFISDIFTKSYNFIVNLFTKIGNFIVDIWNKIYTTTVNIATKTWNGIVKILTPFIRFFTYIFSTIFSAVSAILNALYVLITEILKFIYRKFVDVLTVTYNFVAKIFGKIRDFVVKILTSVYNFIAKILTNIYNFFKKIFTSVYNFVAGIAVKIYNYLSQKFQQVYNFFVNILTKIYNFFKNIFQKIYNFVSGIALKIYNYLRDRFTKSYNDTVSIFTKVYNFLRNIWLKVYNYIAGKVSAVWTKVRDTWNSLKTKTSEIFSGIYNDVRTWFNKMVDRAKELPGKLGDGIGKMAGKVTEGIKKVVNNMASMLGKGVNGVIGGVNWVLDKIGSDSRVKEWKVPTYAKGTKGHPGGLAVVGDGGENEMVLTPDGKIAISPNKDTLVNLPKGSQVIPGKETKSILSMIPHYKDGIFSTIGGGIKNAANATKDFAVKTGKTVATTAKKGAKAVADFTGNVWDYATNPGKLLDIALKTLGVEIPSGSSFIANVAKGGFKKVKDTAINFVKDKMSDLLSFGDSVSSSGGAQAWRGNIQKAAAFMRESATMQEINGIIAQIARESGGNQNIVQSSAVVDVNTLAGNPAKGLLQYIPQTFRAYAMRGHNNIFSGYDQLLAFFNNRNWRRDLPYGTRGWGPTGARKYADGGIVNSKQLAWIADGGWAESIISHDPAKANRSYDIWKHTGEQLGFGQDNKKTLAFLERIARAVENEKERDVVMDGRSVGKVVERYVTEQQNRKTDTKNRFKKRI